MNRLLIDHVRIINEGQTFDGAVVIEGEKISEVLYHSPSDCHTY